MGAGGGEVIRAMPERKHSFFKEAFPYVEHPFILNPQSPLASPQEQPSCQLEPFTVAEHFQQLPSTP